MDNPGASVRQGIPCLDTQTAAFMNAPNSVLGTGEGRLRLAQCPIGFEFYSYATVKALFEDARLRPREKANFRCRGALDIVFKFV